MAWAAFLSITIGPALIVLMTGAKVIPEHKHPISRLLHRLYYPWVSMLMTRRILSIVIAVVAVASSYPIYKKLGSEFMPPLNEGTILYMPTSLPTMSITEATRLMQIQDRILKQFPEVLTVHGKAGRSETATDPAPMEMFETVVQLKPEKEWRHVPNPRWYSSWAPEWTQKGLRKIWPDARPLTWDELITEMDEALQIPGQVNAWTMPIKGRIDMLTTGIRTPVGIKIFGPDLEQIAKLGEHLESVMREVPGHAQRVCRAHHRRLLPRHHPQPRGNRPLWPERRGRPDAGGDLHRRHGRRPHHRGPRALHHQRPLQPRAARRRGQTQARARPRHVGDAGRGRNGAAPIGRWRRCADSASGAVHPGTSPQIPLGQLVDIRTTSGPPVIRNENGALTGWVYVDMAGRDIGGYVTDAKKAVSEKIEQAGLLPTGYRFEWSGQYEHMLRVRERLKLVVPITLALIFVLLYMNFKSVAETFIILLSIPFAMTGSIWLLWLLDYNLSIAVWVGIIALAGLAAQTGTVMIIYLDEAFHAYQQAGPHEDPARPLRGHHLRRRPARPPEAHDRLHDHPRPGPGALGARRWRRSHPAHRRPDDRRPDHQHHPHPRNRPRHLFPLARTPGRMGQRPEASAQEMGRPEPPVRRVGKGGAPDLCCPAPTHMTEDRSPRPSWN